MYHFQQQGGCENLNYFMMGLEDSVMKSDRVIYRSFSSLGLSKHADPWFYGQNPKVWPFIGNPFFYLIIVVLFVCFSIFLSFVILEI